QEYDFNHSRGNRAVHNLIVEMNARSLRYKSVQNAKWRAQTLSRAAAKCFVPPKHFLASRQSVSSCPITFSRHDKVFRPAQSLSHATRKCLALPNHFLAPRESVWSRSFAKLGSLGIFANSLRPPPVATAQRTQTSVMDCDKRGGRTVV